MQLIRKISLISFFFIYMQNICFSQIDSIEKEIIRGKELIQIASNTASKEYFEEAKNIFKGIILHNNYQALANYYLGYINYNLGVVIYRMEKEAAVVYLDSAVEQLERAIEIDENFAEAHALLASCYGIKISFSPIKGIWLGPKSGIQMNKAIKLSPENPRVALLDAIGTYNTPAMFGGGKEKGFKKLKRAAELFDKWKTVDPLQPDWGKEQVYAWIGMVHLARKEIILARKAFEKALEINPDYGWVKYSLMKKVTSENILEKDN